MILATSAVAAILFGEPEAFRYIQLIYDTDRCLLSVANFEDLANPLPDPSGTLFAADFAQPVQAAPEPSISLLTGIGIVPLAIRVLVRTVT